MSSEKLLDRSFGFLGACLGLGAVLALLAFLLLGLTVWAALLAGLLLICPLVIGWGAIVVGRRRPRPPPANKEP